MKTYFKYSDTGEYLSTLYLEEDEALRQENITLIVPPTKVGFTAWFTPDGWKLRPMVINEPEARVLRQREYPPVHEQLDMLWHAMDRGEIPVAEGFYETIKNIKDTYPKADKVFDIHTMPEP